MSHLVKYVIFINTFKNIIYHTIQSRTFYCINYQPTFYSHLFSYFSSHFFIKKQKDDQKLFFLILIYKGKESNSIGFENNELKKLSG